MKHFSVRLAIAESFGINFADVEDDYRYQYTRTPCAVYSINDGYYTATKSVNKKPNGNDEYHWSPCSPVSGYIPDGWRLWVAARI